MMKVNIERRTVDVPASCLPAGTVIDKPYRIIRDVEFKGWD